MNVWAEEVDSIIVGLYFFPHRLDRTVFLKLFTNRLLGVIYELSVKFKGCKKLNGPELPWAEQGGKQSCDLDGTVTRPYCSRILPSENTYE